MKHIFFLLMSCMLLDACSDTLISNGRIGGIWSDKDLGVTYTTADVRMIIERPDPHGSSRKIVCTEPSPDVAKALSAAAQGSAQGSGGGTGSTNVTLSGGFSSAEALLELAGRSTALLGLRDGVFRACEAYANGMIGDAAYGLILARYGQLMVTLFLSQDIENAALPATNSITAPAVTLGGGNATTGTSKSDGTGDSAAGKKQSSLTGHSVSRDSNVGQVKAQMLAAAGLIPLAQSVKTSSGTVLSDGPSPAGHATGVHDMSSYQQFLIPAQSLSRTPDTATAPAKNTSQPAAKPQQNADTATVTDAAASILGLGKAYLGLGSSGLIAVACINEYDGTRADAFDVQGRPVVNNFLRRICEDPRISSILLTAPADANTVPSPSRGRR